MTLSCGTGSTASAIAASIVWEMAAPIQVQTQGDIGLPFHLMKREVSANLSNREDRHDCRGRLYDEALPKDIE